MKTFFMKTFLGGCLLIFSITNLQSQQRAQLFPGARPFGLGETFVAIADDGNAIYWNPAGLPYLNREEFHFMYSNLYGINIKNLYFSYTRPLFKNFAFGVDWLRYGFDDNELDFSRNHWNLSFGYALNNQLAFGSNIKLLTTNTTLENIYYGNAWGAGIDLGLLVSHQFKKWRFLKELRAGLMLYDATDTWIRFDSGTQEKILPRNLRFGFSYKPFDSMSWRWLTLYEPIIALDVDDRIHVGGEVWFFQDKLPFAIRGGAQKDRYSDEGLTWSAGFSVQKDFFRIDYALTMPPILPATHRFSIALIYNFNPHLVEISNIQTEPIFSALYNHYNNVDKQIGKATLKNNSDEPLDKAKVTFTIKEYTQTPPISWEGRVDTVVTDVDLFAKFKENLKDVNEKETSLTGEVEVSYNYRNSSFKEKATVEVFVYGNQAIRWNEPGRAVAFVTQDDSLVRSFAITANRDYEIESAEWFFKREIADAVKIFESLRAYGVGPTVDPNATLSCATADGFYIDTIQWPDALLSKPRDQRKGDCEDLAVLYASLLESIGIKTALLKTTGHIFMMFNTGIPAAHRFCLPVRDSLIVKEKGCLWLPIETTLLRSSFIDAWHEGASNFWSAIKQQDLDTLFVIEQQNKYPSMSHSPVKRQWWTFPDSLSVFQLVADDFQKIDRLKDVFIQDFNLALLKHDSDSLNIRNKQGCIYVGLSQLDRAKNEFKTVLDVDSTYVPALNNKGNIHFIRGEIDSAQQYYENCLSTQKFKSGTYINLAILYQFMSELEAFKKDSLHFHNASYEMLKRVVHLFSEDSTEVLALAGISQEERQTMADQPEKKQKRKSLKNRIREIKKFINKSLAILIDKRPKTTKLETAGPTGDQKDEDRQFILFWDF